jgi:hypothetical protein
VVGKHLGIGGHDTMSGAQDPHACPVARAVAEALAKLR